MPVVEIFDLTVAPHGTYRYTSANQDIEYGGETYAQVAISRQQVEQKSDLATPSHIRVEFPLDSEFAQLFTGFPPQQDATATIRRGVYDFSTGITSVETVVLDGLVTSTGSEDGAASFEIHPITEIVNRVGPRRLYSGACQNRLYGPGCRLNKVDFEEEVTIATGTLDQDTRVLEFLSNVEHPAGYFVGGLFQADTNDPLMIVAQPAPEEPVAGIFRYTITLARWGDGMTDQPTVITPGCDYSRATCIARFDNLENFGGFDKLQNVDRSPFLNGWAE